jgi:phytoene desaturase (3,4-didehydrolycopene-forming)
MDAIMILVPCPTLQRNEIYSSLPRNEAFIKYKNEQFPDELIDRVRTAVLHRLGVLSTLSHLQEYILHEVVETPVDYAEQYNVGAGTPFGLSHGLQQLSVFRPPSIFDPNKSQLLSKSVFFCGASTRPGNGVPLVLTSAKLVADQVMKLINDLP